MYYLPCCIHHFYMINGHCNYYVHVNCLSKICCDSEYTHLLFLFQLYEFNVIMPGSHLSMHSFLFIFVFLLMAIILVPPKRDLDLDHSY